MYSEINIINSNAVLNNEIRAFLTPMDDYLAIDFQFQFLLTTKQIDISEMVVFHKNAWSGQRSNGGVPLACKDPWIRQSTLL